jgi:hypothetical protein
MFPIIVRFKLDNCGIKLKLTKWRKMTAAERVSLANQACDSEEEILAYRNSLKNLVFSYTKREASDLSIQRNPPWAMDPEVPSMLVEKLTESNVSLTISQWQRLEILQRFALTKLCGSNHERKNFVRALKEFKLVY